MMKKGAKKGSKENEENSSDQEDVKQDYDELCRQLNMDVETAETAWQSFIETKDKVRITYCCAIYFFVKYFMSKKYFLFNGFFSSFEVYFGRKPNSLVGLCFVGRLSKLDPSYCWPSFNNCSRKWSLSNQTFTK